MRTRIIILLTFITIAGPLFSQIPNSGFESWTNIGSYSTPDNWGNLNAVTASSGIYTCVKGSPGNPGTAYLKLISKTVSGMGVQPGIAVSGLLNTTTFEAVSGFPYSERPASLDGAWQFMANVSVTRHGHELEKFHNTHILRQFRFPRFSCNHFIGQRQHSC